MTGDGLYNADDLGDGQHGRKKDMNELHDSDSGVLQASLQNPLIWGSSICTRILASVRIIHGVRVLISWNKYAPAPPRAQGVSPDAKNLVCSIFDLVISKEFQPFLFSPFC